MEIYNQNQRLLKMNNPLLLTLNKMGEKVDNQDIGCQIENVLGNDVLYIENGYGFMVPLHSTYDVKRENSVILSSLDSSKDELIIVFGSGYFYHLEEIQIQASAQSRIFVIEYELNSLKYVLRNKDCSKVLADERFIFISGTDRIIEQMIIAYFGINFYNLAHNMKIIQLPNYYQKYSERILGTIKSINRRILSQLYSYGNSLEDIFNGFVNNYKNVDACIEANGFDEIEDLYKDVPAIIVASGPSLDKNIKDLPHAVGKAVIMSCDASLDICRMYDIQPDCVASIERDPEIYEYYYKNKSFDEKLVLVGPSLLWPDIFKDFRGKKILSTKMDTGVESWWSDQFERMKYVDTGQSSATYAYAAAVRMGCNPIILIGQDLGYSEGRIHSEHTHHSEQGANDDHRHDGVYLPDYDGNLLKSNIGYRLFKEWYELKIMANDNITVINATEGGAYIQGTIRMQLLEAIKKYCVNDKKQNVYDNLTEIILTNDDYIAKYNDIEIDIDKEIKKIREVQKKADIHIELLKHVQKEYLKSGLINESDYYKVINELSQGDQVVNYILHNDESHSIRNYYKQLVVQTISNVKKISSELNDENLLKNYELQMNLMLIISKSSDVIEARYEEMRRYLHLKRDRRLNEVE